MPHSQDQSESKLDKKKKDERWGTKTTKKINVEGLKRPKWR
jgi:hypothetical protein